MSLVKGICFHPHGVLEPQVGFDSPVRCTSRRTHSNFSCHMPKCPLLAEHGLLSRSHALPHRVGRLARVFLEETSLVAQLSRLFVPTPSSWMLFCRPHSAKEVCRVGDVARSVAEDSCPAVATLRAGIEMLFKAQLEDPIARHVFSQDMSHVAMTHTRHSFVALP